MPPCIRCTDAESDKTGHSTCIRHADCWLEKLFHPSRCSSCKTLREAAFNPEQSPAQTRARDCLRSWIKLLIANKRSHKDFDPTALWASSSDRSKFTGIWCLDLQALGVGTAIRKSLKRDRSVSSCRGSRSSTPLSTKRTKKTEDPEARLEIYLSPQPRVSGSSLSTDLDVSSRDPSPSLQSEPESPSPAIRSSEVLQRAVEASLGTLANQVSKVVSDYLPPPAVPSDRPAPDFLPVPDQAFDLQQDFASLAGPGEFQQEWGFQDPAGFSQVPLEGPCSSENLWPHPSQVVEPGTQGPQSCLNPASLVDNGPRTASASNEELTWFVPPQDAAIDFSAGSLLFEGAELGSLVRLKEMDHWVLFSPLVVSDEVSAMMDRSVPYVKPAARDPKKLSLFELISSAFRHGTNPFSSNWGIGPEGNSITANLSLETKIALGVEPSPYIPPLLREMKLNFSGKDDPNSVRILETLNAPKITKTDTDIGGPFDGLVSPLKTEVFDCDARRRAELLTLVEIKSSLELAHSLSSHEALKSFNLPTAASIHMSHVGKALGAADRLLTPLLAKSAATFRSYRSSLHSQALSRVRSEGVKKEIGQLNVFSPGLWPEEGKESLISAARQAISDQSWKTSSKKPASKPKKPASKSNKFTSRSGNPAPTSTTSSQAHPANPQVGHSHPIPYFGPRAPGASGPGQFRQQFSPQTYWHGFRRPLGYHPRGGQNFRHPQYYPFPAYNQSFRPPRAQGPYVKGEKSARGQYSKGSGRGKHRGGHSG